MSKNGMFKDVGKQIEAIAETHATMQLLLWGIISGAIFIISIIISATLGNTVFLLIGLLLAVLVFYIGYTVAKLSSIRLYAYGQLVDHMQKIIKHLDLEDEQDEPATPVEPEKETSADGIVSYKVEGSCWFCPECCREIPNTSNKCPCGYTKQ